MTKVTLILAADPNGVIGVNGTMPWHYKSDFKRFKERTMGGTLIMGNSTWESLPKPLPGRRCVVLTRQMLPSTRHTDDRVCMYAPSWDKALDIASRTCPVPPPPVWMLGAMVGMDPPAVWIAGGLEVYQGALRHPGLVDEIDYTLVPEVPAEKLVGNVTRLPKDLLEGFELVEEAVNAEDNRLRHRIYRCTLQHSK